MSHFTLRTFIFDHGTWENLISNCSIKSFEEWRAQSVPNIPIGLLYLLMGTIFETLYIPFIFVMKKPEFIRHSCYKFMLQLCIIDIMVLPCNAIIPGIQTLFGLHFCTCPTLFFMTGYISAAGWYAGSITSVLLALDRFFEMIWPRGAKLMFEGKRFFIWLGLLTTYIIFYFSTQLPGAFSTIAFANLFDPFYGTPGLNPMPEFMFYTFHFAHNFTVVVLLGTIYLTLCIAYIIKIKLLMNVTVSRHQKLVTIQAMCICVEFFIAALVYVFLLMFPVSDVIIIIGHICWILMHGDTPIVYLILNKSLRNAVFRLVRIKSDVNVSVMHQVHLSSNRVVAVSIH